MAISPPSSAASSTSSGTRSPSRTPGTCPPLIVDHQSGFIETNIGPPIGISAGRSYKSVTVPIPAGATLLLYTDGLIERPSESLDEGFQKLRNLVIRSEASLSLPDLLNTLVTELCGDAHSDDTAVLGLRWRT